MFIVPEMACTVNISVVLNCGKETDLALVLQSMKRGVYHSDDGDSKRAN
jgi:hypothetical protein